MCATIVNIYSVVHLSHICNMSHIRGLNGVVEKKFGSRGRQQGFKSHQTPKIFCFNYDDTDNKLNFRT